MKIKSLICVLVKLILFGLFLFNSGVIPAIHHEAIEREKSDPLSGLSQQEVQRRKGILSRMRVNIEEKVRDRVVNKGGIYSPYEAFDDRYQLKKKSKELGIWEEDNLNNRLFLSGMMRSSSLEAGYTQADIDAASHEFNRKCFEELGLEDFDPRPKKFLEINWGRIGRWLLKFYLHNIPLAFVLFVVWLIQGSHRFLLIPRPLRFLWLILVYPVTIFRVMNIRATSVIWEAEIRRRKADIFDPLSEEEATRLKGALERRLSLTEWRRQLDDLSFKPQHGLALALVVTLVFVLLPRPLKSEIKTVKTAWDVNVTLERIANTSLPRMSIDNCKSQTGAQDFLGDRDIAANWTTITHYIVGLCAINFRAHFKRLLPPDEIFQIPRLAVHFEMAIISIQK